MHFVLTFPILKLTSLRARTSALAGRPPFPNSIVLNNEKLSFGGSVCFEAAELFRAAGLFHRVTARAGDPSTLPRNIFAAKKCAVTPPTLKRASSRCSQSIKRPPFRRAASPRRRPDIQSSASLAINPLYNHSTYPLTLRFERLVHRQYFLSYEYESPHLPVSLCSQSSRPTDSHF
ncbi:hypothetical protein EVAR_67044_1 [Eumeta japonica]|uniref:Uncharacterized protein n=1 Tax=Eumeta variegata TaxID=151549 RepID=A0A4C1ZVI7_EUMVA|nr:hypothetical protein EVAR_67044_1 [Eumeta japonica]